MTTRVPTSMTIVVAKSAPPRTTMMTHILIIKTSSDTLTVVDVTHPLSRDKRHTSTLTDTSRIATLTAAVEFDHAQYIQL